VESSCKLGNELSGSIKCWELPSGRTTCGLSSGTQLHRVSLVSYPTWGTRTPRGYSKPFYEVCKIGKSISS
jgi:hypothetical protein